MVCCVLTSINAEETYGDVKFKTARPCGFQNSSRDFISNDSEPETLSAENFEIMVQLNKAKENN